MKDYFPSILKDDGLISNTEIMAACKISHRQNYMRFLVRAGYNSTQPVVIRGKHYQLKKRANEIVDRYLKWDAEQEKKRDLYVELRDTVEKHRIANLKRYTEFKTWQKSTNNLMGNHSQKLFNVERTPNRLDAQSKHIDQIHHSLQNQLEEQSALIDELSGIVENLRGEIYVLKRDKYEK